MSNHDVAITLFIVGFLLQLAGIVLVVLDIRDDLRAAQEIQERPPDAPREVIMSTPQVEHRIGGALGGLLGAQEQAIDTFRIFTAERLAGDLGRRILGVVLFVLGAVMSLAANIVAL
jgi:hypothetical protein